ncbi:MAG: hypothetical protein HXS48_14965 [Theionarchaea archaeon]|nr:MAG: hypothetical protein AYK19_20570 [Theionarchaea archaeon DG-70-1]MBU7028232.1 hypothetical protein [Theionarchaea archaeon]
MLPENLLMDITRFALNDADEREIALLEFEKSLGGRSPTLDEIESFEMDYIFARKHSLYKKSFIRLFVERFEELYGKEWSKDILSLDENFEGFFEVVTEENGSVVATNLVMGEQLEIQYPADCDVSKGDILTGRVFKWRGDYYFFGPLGAVNEEQDIKSTKAFAFRMKEMCENATKSFIEYFGTNVVIFKDREELEEKFDKVIYWFYRNKTPPGVYEEGEELEHLTFEELREKKEIALLIDFDAGHRVVPEYGYAVKLFSGKWEEVPNYKERVKTILFHDEIPSYYIEKMIEKTPEPAVKLYSQFFPQVKTKEDLIELFSKYRRDWGIKLRRQSLFLER